MTIFRRLRPALPAVLLLLGATAQANDFPTAERVLYVQECMRDNPGPNFEMVHKCSCAVDIVAGAIRHDDFVDIATVAKAMSIGGERGNEIRDTDALKPKLRQYRELQAKARKACMIQPR